MSATVLILGASGRFGRNAAEAFWNAGWQVRSFDRDKDDLQSAAQGVDVIVNGWNPPYPKWEREVPKLTQRVIEAARQSGATVIIPGNVYVYGNRTDPIMGSDTPHAATNPLGIVRRKMESAYRDAGVRTIVLRAGDFIDTEPSGNWFDLFVVKNAGRGQIIAPGDPAIPHAWAYLPDLARAAVELAEKRDTLEQFHEVLFPGYTFSINDIAELVAQATGRAQKVKRFNWLPIRLAAPFWSMGRKLLEVRYLWFMPHRISGTDMSAQLANFRETDPLAAIAQAIAHLDINPDQSMPRGVPRLRA